MAVRRRRAAPGRPAAATHTARAACRYNWVEERAFGAQQRRKGRHRSLSDTCLLSLLAAGFYPNPVMPVPACMVDPKDSGLVQQACDACKAAVKVTVRGMHSQPQPSAKRTDSHTRAASCPS